MECRAHAAPPPAAWQDHLTELRQLMWELQRELENEQVRQADAVCAVRELACVRSARGDSLRAGVLLLLCEWKAKDICWECIRAWCVHAFLRGCVSSVAACSLLSGCSVCVYVCLSLFGLSVFLCVCLVVRAR